MAFLLGGDILEEAFFNGIANNGFAALVAGGLLWQLNKTINRLIDWVTKWKVDVKMTVAVQEEKEV